MAIRSRFDTHEVFNQSPPYEDVDLFASDAPLRRSGQGERRSGRSGRAVRIRQAWGTAEMFALARQANENPPKLHAFDAKGYRLDTVEFHPAYHAFMRASIAAGLHASTWTATGQRAAPPAEVLRAARFYMAAQVETGHLCPITMTRAALAPLAAEPALAAKIVAEGRRRAATTPTFRPWWEKSGMTLGMGMTEKQGGTDVRANTTTATPHDGDAYSIVGHKWFFSAPMSDAFLVLAQAPGGLTCFLMPRFRPDGSVNALRFQRLKDKLGNRSNASSEVEFTDAFAWRVGEEGAGIRTILQMVQLTRLDCAVASAGLMRMALVQAVHHCRHRNVFRKRLSDQPMMRAVLADMALDVEAAVALVFRLSRALDRAATDAREAAYARLMTPAAKFWICKLAPGFIFEAMELPRRQRLRRRKPAAAALSRGAGQRHLGRLRQCHVPRRAARAEGQGRSRIVCRSGARRRPRCRPGKSTIDERSRCAPHRSSGLRCWRAPLRSRKRAVCDRQHIFQNARRKNARCVLRHCRYRFTNS